MTQCFCFRLMISLIQNMGNLKIITLKNQNISMKTFRAINLFKAINDVKK